MYFKHIGHTGPVVDFDWNKLIPFVIASASDDFEAMVQGASLQLFRPSLLLRMNKEEIIDMLMNK